MECPICGREVNKLVKAEIEGAIVEVCERCANKYGKIVSLPEIKKRKSKVKNQEEEELEVVENYGEIIRKRRIALGLSQEELAKKINEKKSLISKIEREEIIPDEKTTKKLERFLNVSLLFKPDVSITTAETKRKKLTIGDIVEVK